MRFMPSGKKIAKTATALFATGMVFFIAYSKAFGGQTYFLEGEKDGARKNTMRSSFYAGYNTKKAETFFGFKVGSDFPLNFVDSTVIFSANAGVKEGKSGAVADNFSLGFKKEFSKNVSADISLFKNSLYFVDPYGVKITFGWWGQSFTLEAMEEDKYSFAMQKKIKLSDELSALPLVKIPFEQPGLKVEELGLGSTFSYKTDFASYYLNGYYQGDFSKEGGQYTITLGIKFSK